MVGWCQSTIDTIESRIPFGACTPRLPPANISEHCCGISGHSLLFTRLTIHSPSIHHQFIHSSIHPFTKNHFRPQEIAPMSRVPARTNSRELEPWERKRSRYHLRLGLPVSVGQNDGLLLTRNLLFVTNTQLYVCSWWILSVLVRFVGLKTIALPVIKHFWWNLPKFCLSRVLPKRAKIGVVQLMRIMSKSCWSLVWPACCAPEFSNAVLGSDTHEATNQQPGLWGLMNLWAFTSATHHFV